MEQNCYDFKVVLDYVRQYALCTCNSDRDILMI